MDAKAIIYDLKNQLARVNEAIATCERIAAMDGHKRRGRPPEWLKVAKGSGQTAAGSNGQVKRRGRVPGSKNKPKVE